MFIAFRFAGYHYTDRFSPSRSEVGPAEDSITTNMASCLHHEHVEPPEPIAQGKILFKNVNVFDGENEALMMEQDVLVVKNLIAKIVPTGRYVR